MKFFIIVALLGVLTMVSSQSVPKTAQVHVINLNGTLRQMGFQYGQQLRGALTETLDIIKQHARENNVTFTNLIEQASRFHRRYSYPYVMFLYGMSEGSGLSMAECMVLNAMETLQFKGPVSPACAFLFIPPSQTATQSSFVGRNYDYYAPFDKIAKNLVVAIFDHSYLADTAIIGLPGQIYCPTCINSHGVLVELNNGMPSGGFASAEQRKSLLINLLEDLERSSTLEELGRQLRSRQSDYSLIINTADSRQSEAYEFSAFKGMRTFTPAKGAVYASTNFFQNATWTDVPTPTDNDTWAGVSRRYNLENLTKGKSAHDLASVMDLMDVELTNGGGRWSFTIYQVIVDFSDLKVLLRAPHLTKEWTTVRLREPFQRGANEPIVSIIE